MQTRFRRFGVSLRFHSAAELGSRNYALDHNRLLQRSRRQERAMQAHLLLNIRVV